MLQRSGTELGVHHMTRLVLKKSKIHYFFSNSFAVTQVFEILVCWCRILYLLINISSVYWGYISHICLLGPYIPHLFTGAIYPISVYWGYVLSISVYWGYISHICLLGLYIPYLFTGATFYPYLFTRATDKASNGYITDIKTVLSFPLCDPLRSFFAISFKKTRNV